MHLEILSEEQTQLLPLISVFKKEFYLVGGTAIAIQIGHRRSIDFDLFKLKPINRKKILEKVSSSGLNYQILYTNEDQLNMIIGGVKFTFLQFPYKIPAILNLHTYCNMPGLLDLAAMKAFALGKRAKWKDYVDLYFLLKYHFTIKQISTRAHLYFTDLFSEKLFKAQLVYFANINFEEEVEYVISPEPSEEQVKYFLIEIATEKI